MGNVFNMVGGGGGIKLASIAVTTAPTTTTYTAGNAFSTAGMVVTATYSNGATLTGVDYSYSPTGALEDGTTEITVQYTEGGVTKTTTVGITVIHRLESIAITTQPTTTSYTVADTFDSAGMVVTATYSDGTTASVTGYTWTPTEFEDEGTETITVSYTERSITKTTTLTVTVEAAIFGVYWDGSSDPSWTRTDSAANFADPVPYVAGATTYSSPFDKYLPWSGMERVSDDEAGELVKIPKFWYKWTRDGTSMKLQISNKAQDGYYVSPAHVDRGDGVGERDYVYVGRYHCSSSDYKSTSGVSPKGGITMETARTNIVALGDTIWQFDFAMLWTIRMLYLVEFAHWDCQEKIGYGTVATEATSINEGSTDDMPYHTGTMQSSRQTYGQGVQYRYIEGLWENKATYCDGVYFSTETLYGILNPADYTIGSGGTAIGSTTTTAGCIQTWTDNPTTSGFEGWIFAATTTSATDYTIYSCDRVVAASSPPIMFVGVGYGLAQTLGAGLFYSGRADTTINGSGYGCRLQKLP